MTPEDLLALHQANAKKFRSMLRDHGLSIRSFSTIQEAAEALSKAQGSNPPTPKQKASEHATDRPKTIEVDFTPPPELPKPKRTIEIDFRALVQECLEEYEAQEAETQVRKAEAQPESPRWWPLGSLDPDIARKAAVLLKNRGFKVQVDDIHGWGKSWGRVMIYGNRVQDQKAQTAWYEFRQKHM